MEVRIYLERKKKKCYFPFFFEARCPSVDVAVMKFSAAGSLAYHCDMRSEKESQLIDMRVKVVRIK